MFPISALSAVAELAAIPPAAYHWLMSTVQEIELAIEGLPKTERDALESRLLAKRYGLSGLSNDEQAELLRSLDEAERDIDEGRIHSADDLRQAVRGWVGK